MTPLRCAAALVLATAILATALEVRLVEHESGEPIGETMWTSIEYACALWGDRLGFDRCYCGDTVTVYLRMTKAGDYPDKAFMYTNALPETFPGSRRLLPGSSTTITFKDRAYVYRGPEYGWNEDARWFMSPDPSFSAFWDHCDVFAEGVCDAEGVGGKQFDFISHMGHEFGHVFGFVGTYLAFGRTEGSPGGFEGIDYRGEPFAFDFSGNASHAATSMMSLGFSAWQRAYPSARELDACRVVFGYAGTFLYAHDAVSLPKNQTTTVSFDVDSSFTVGTVEYTSSYTPRTLSPDSEVAVLLSSPNGTECSLGTLRAGWAKEGYARPADTTGRGSYNPPDTLAAFRGTPAHGTWTARYVNSSGHDVELGGCALRLAATEITDARDGRPAVTAAGRTPLSRGRWRVVDPMGRTIAEGHGRLPRFDTLLLPEGVAVVIARGVDGAVIRSRMIAHLR